MNCILHHAPQYGIKIVLICYRRLSADGTTVLKHVAVSYPPSVVFYYCMHLLVGILIMRNIGCN
jgi:hypothetical protein